MAAGASAAEADAAFLPVAHVVASLLLILGLALLARRRASKGTGEEAASAGAEDAVRVGDDRPREKYADPLRWAFLPEGGPNEANVERVETCESDLCTVKVLALHRPTHEPWREKTGQYPFSWHLEGRKRLWEIRLQIRFKQVPKTRVYFGITLGDYVPVSGLARQVQKALVRACRSIVGDLYHSPGDDPARTQGEAEPPTFVMPLWAFDQFIVSNPGQEPHLWGSLEGLGARRTDGIGAYVKAMRSATDSFSTDKVYTFCFWGVSQFLDCMKWEICGGFLPGVRLDFNKLAGSAPVYVAMYEMPGVSEQDADRRHLLSRRRYYYNVAMWSQLRPPRPEVLAKLVGRQSQSADMKDGMHRRQKVGDKLGLLGCCTARGSGLGGAEPEVPEHLIGG